MSSTESESEIQFDESAQARTPQSSEKEAQPIKPVLLKISQVPNPGTGGHTLIELVFKSLEKAFTPIGSRNSLLSKGNVPGAVLLLDVLEFTKYRPQGDEAVTTLVKFIKNNSIILYPLIRNRPDGSLEIMVKIIAEHGNIDIPAQRQIDSLYQLNQAHLTEYLKWRFHNPPSIPAEYEDNPGRIIGNSLDYTRLSAENEIVDKVRKSILAVLKITQDNPHAQVFSDFLFFRRDVLRLFHEGDEIVCHAVAPGLFLPAHFEVESAQVFIPHDQVTYVYRIVGDIIEKGIRKIAANLAAKANPPYTQLKNDLSDFDASYPRVPGDAQSKIRMGGILGIVKHHLIEKGGGLHYNNFLGIIPVFERLLEEMKKEAEKYAAIQIAAAVEIWNNTITFCDDELTLLTPETIFEPDIFRTQEEASRHGQSVIDILIKTRLELLHYEARGKSGSEMYFAHVAQIYFIKANVKLRARKARLPEDVRQLAIIEKMAPKKDSYRDAASRSNPRKTAKTDFILEDINKSETKEKRRLELSKSFSKFYGIAGGLSAGFIVGAVIYLIWENAAYALITGAALAAGAGLYLGIRFSLKSRLAEKENYDRQMLELSAMEKKLDLDEGGRTVKKSPRQKAGDQILGEIIPFKSKTLTDLLFSRQFLLDNIENKLKIITDKIQKNVPGFLKAEDLKNKEKLVTALDDAIKDRFYMMKIPEEYLARGKHADFYIREEDANNPGQLRQIARAHKEVADNERAQKFPNNDLIRYYEYISDFLEKLARKKSVRR